MSSVVTVSLPASAADIELWWPNKMGNQPLYAINASFTRINANGAADAGAPTVASGKKIGFREFAYVTVNDTDPRVVAASLAEGVEGTGNHTAAWRVNGALVFARGANVVPMEELEGRASAAAITRMVRSAADGGMNTLRIWAGAIYFYDAFYDAADRAGLLIYHDLMFIEPVQLQCPRLALCRAHS